MMILYGGMSTWHMCGGKRFAVVPSICMHVPMSIRCGNMFIYSGLRIKKASTKNFGNKETLVM